MHSDTRHIIRNYDLELQRLAGEIVAMGELAVAQLESGMTALGSRDRALAQDVIDRDDSLDNSETEVGHGVLRLLALRQPAAGDLREVLAALRIASDIERIGDYAVNMARRTLLLDRAVPSALAPGLAELAALATGLVRGVVQAFALRDPVQARTIWQRDDAIDASYLQLFADVLTHMRRQPDDIPVCTHLLFVAKSLERAGDHATNIAENIRFASEGEPGREPGRS